MTSHEILKADVLDILFDNRNKMYGAYELRKHYNNRMGIALGIMLSFVLGMSLFLKSSPAEKPLIQDPRRNGPVVIIEIPDEPVLPQLPENRRPVSPPVQRENFVNRIEFVSDHTETDMPPQEALEIAAISNRHEDGPPLIGSEPRNFEAGIGNKNGDVAEESKPEKSSVALQAQAEFPGGQAAWIAFLNRHLRTPNELDAGEKRTVLVRFTVGTDGSISAFDIVHSGGNAFDNEVIRVLKKMPRWKPAIQNGHSVSVIFTQPVTFMAFEE